MTNTRKILGLVLLFFALFALAGCGDKEDDTTPIPLDTTLADGLKLDKSIVGKEFIADGIGEVTLNRAVDGDTISVYSGNTSITIRFLGIDTPESTAKVEPWGKAASNYVKEQLTNASSIVLEAEGERKDSTGKRYLAWVWYKPNAQSDYRLLNLEEVELAYSKYMMDTNSKYFQVLYDANKKATRSLKRIWGEKDPDYNYSKEIVQTSVLYLINNPDEFMTATKFELKVRLVRTVGNNLYLQDAEEVQYEKDGEVVTGIGGVYAFTGYSTQFYLLYKIGDVFTIQTKFEYQGNYGTQLTDLTKASRVTENGEVYIPELDANSINGGAGLEPYDGSVVQLNNLTVTSVAQKTSASGDTYYVVDTINEKGNKFDIYFGNSLITTYDVMEKFVVGGKYNIIGGVAYYEYAEGKYQIAVGDAPRYNGGVINPDDQIRLNDIVRVN